MKDNKIKCIFRDKIKEKDFINDYNGFTMCLKNNYLIFIFLIILQYLMSEMVLYNDFLKFQLHILLLELNELSHFLEKFKFLFHYFYL